ncbi:acetyl-CoA hydrolase/transferase family protein [Burkholderia gladioli]|uniref:acetyl-CoA hydrolase/transferase family protein n=1 Tax=Burkholderia gladioli TaxID=28095 RepID=UPI0006271A5A|nr:acetyl-CoA hydrolase/transferase C-terminal domain-containing protein [Burkholderia gladioli]KKJ08655.1 4-hydroxybutyrate CoA-transferase [Burkholderia gladioli]MDN7500786.1 acetyl-CoA hydrolase/transferase C-terminal domain-containing protein [Burkholderia gladioli]MDN7604167.1 acetyl-CoA hydrolase/transferase C-terminal domain-containing protein [Burkholderia gladioli]MDN7917716.1 acetyl-CoA hydrolase/transferase C-terminal domain-containing protein [Burkholderia gladioli]POS04274.1 4-hyd
MERNDSIQGAYAAKLTSATEAVSSLRSGSTVALGMAMAQPPALLTALAARAEAGDVDDLAVYYFHAESFLRTSLLRYSLMGRIVPHCMFMGEPERELIELGEKDGGRKVVFFVPNSFSQAPRLFADHIPVDTMLVMVSPMDRNGYFTFGTNNDYTSTVARSARRLIVEVNPNMPRVFGRSLLHISEVDAIVESHDPLPELHPKPAGVLEQAIGERIAELVSDGACLQMGIGALPNAVCGALADHRHLGIHTELLTPGLVELVRRGVVDNSRKALDRGKSVFTFAMGDRAMYNFMDDNPAIESHPVDYVNDPANIARNDNMISVNSTIEMDLTGACNSEHLHGHQFSASGGQLDFVRGAYASRGGKSIIAFSSTAAGGRVSKIVGRLAGPVTTPRTDTHLVVTEHGVENLKGLSSTQRAMALIRLAHPDFRDALQAQARELHLI